MGFFISMLRRIISLVLIYTVVCAVIDQNIVAQHLINQPLPPQISLVIAPPSSTVVSARPFRKNINRTDVPWIKCVQVSQIDLKLYQLDFQINQETVNKVDFRPSEPLELYFLAQYLQERIQSKRNVSVYGLYQALPESLRRQLEMPLTSKESLFRIRDLLWRASFDQLARYGSRNGNYYLAKDLKQTFGRSLYLGQIYEGVHINLGSLYTLIGDGLEVASFLGMVDKRFETEWNVRRVHLSLKQKDWKDRG